MLQIIQGQVIEYAEGFEIGHGAARRRDAIDGVVVKLLAQRLANQRLILGQILLGEHAAVVTHPGVDGIGDFTMVHSRRALLRDTAQ